MNLRVLYLLCLFAATSAHASPFGDCPGAFEKIFPAEIALAARSMPALTTLSVEKARKVQLAELSLLPGAPSRRSSQEVITQLQEAVGILQTERRAIFKRIDDLRRAQGNSTADPGGEIQALQNEVYALMSHLVPLRNQLGRITIEAAATATAAETGMLVLLRSTQAPAAGQLVHKGVGKGISIKFHSASEGAIAGLIPYQQRLSAKVAAKGEDEIAKMQQLVNEALARGQVVKLKYRAGPLVAVERDGTVKFVNSASEKVPDDEIVEVIAVLDENWYPRVLTSDVDPLAFGRKEGLPEEIPYNSKERGIITRSEREAVRAYNRQVSKLLKKNAGTFMAHGADNRSPVSPGVSGYPISAHYPDGRTALIEKGPPEDPDLHLKRFFQEAKGEGFHLQANPLWGW